MLSKTKLIFSLLNKGFHFQSVLNVFIIQTRKMSHKTATVSCNISCLQNTHHPILLPDGVPVNIGRSPQTKITDSCCSRNQVSLTADWTRREVKVTQLGANNSSIDGMDIGKGLEVVMKPSSTLFILAGAYPHKVSFKTSKKGETDDGGLGSTPVPVAKRKQSDDSSSSDTKKRKLEDKSENDREKKSSSKILLGNGASKKAKCDESANSGEDVKEKEAKLVQLKALAAREKSSASNDKKKHSAGTTDKVTTPDRKTENICTPSSSASSSTSSKKSSSSSVKPCEKSEWTSHDQLHVYTSKGVVPHSKIAAFDMDGTIILTKSGKVFPTNRDDWRIFAPDVFGKLKQLVAKGFKIVFFTNQMGVAKGRTNLDDLKIKVENIVSRLQVPVQVFIATHEGRYRKPNDGMWDKLRQSYNGGKEINLKESKYIGDAAGRDKDWEPKKKKDFSCGDRLFALNVGVQFFTPEEFFLGKKATSKFTMPAFDPRKLKSEDGEVPPEVFQSSSKEILVLVGFPACGKSHFSSTVLQPKGYKIVSRDELGSWQKCIKQAQTYLVDSSVVVDNTNLTEEERKRYINLAQDARVPCRCLVFNTSVDHCRHNERFRQLSGGKHAKINEMVFNKMKSSYKEPSRKEGFSQVIPLNFVPRFSSKTEEARYRKFLLEK